MAGMVALTQLSATKLVTNAPPLVVRNRRSNFRTTGRIRTPSYSQPMQDALRDGLERLVTTVSQRQDALRRVTTLVIAPLVLVTARVPYAHLVVESQTTIIW